MICEATAVVRVVPKRWLFVFPPLALLFGVGLLMLTSSASASGPASHPTQAARGVTNDDPNLFLSPNNACTFIPGDTDIGNHCDDCVTHIALPFAFSFYGQTFTTANISSNGNLQFVSNDNAWANVCLPVPTFNYAILPYWDDLRTDCTGCGVFTALRSTTSNRTFIIEWRTNYNAGGTANFEVLLHEGPASLTIVYGRVDRHGDSATVGLQGPLNLYTQYACNGGGIQKGLCLPFSFGR
jgi:hypothetical protein